MKLNASIFMEAVINLGITFKEMKEVQKFLDRSSDSKGFIEGVDDLSEKSKTFVIKILEGTGDGELARQIEEYLGG